MQGVVCLSDSLFLMKKNSSFNKNTQSNQDLCTQEELKVSIFDAGQCGSLGWSFIP